MYNLQKKIPFLILRKIKLNQVKFRNFTLLFLVIYVKLRIFVLYTSLPYGTVS